MKNKKILCLSWCDADNVINYGQILQALAMMALLRNYTDEKIEYVSFFPRNIKSLIRYYIDHLSVKNGHLQAYIKTRKTIKKYTDKFNVKLSHIRKSTELERYKDIDFMICGSDQIWHPCNYNKVFFLDIEGTEAKRIAFAASLPKTFIEEQFVEQYKHIKEAIKKLDSIAVREQSSIDLISKLSNKKVISVLDPTFLVSRNMWEEVMEAINVPNKYIFIYIPNGMNADMVEFVKKIKIKMKIEDVLVVVTRGNNLFTDSINLNFVSLGQFLYLIKNASLVVTSSFHAVVFSTLFHTDFYAYDIYNNLRGEDCRLVDILDILGLRERNIQGKDLKEICAIDFEMVDRLIKNKKIEALTYLKNELS